MDAMDYAEKASEIFVLSDSFIRIKELIDDEASTIDDISDVILIDPALAATLLKLANSSFFNYPGKIDTISKAVLVLGITEVYNLVIAYFTTKAFKSISAPVEFLESFWEQSVDCALMIKYLGFKLGVPKAERLFILGLLHNLGELVMQQFQAEQVEVANQITSTELPWNKQQEVFGFTYADCTAELLKLWQLPYNLIEPIRFQNDEDFQYSTMETKLLYIAKRMMQLNRQCKSHVQEDVLANEKLTSLSLQQDVIAEANNYCDMERLGILAVLNPSAAMIY
jgi:HD-like signal output (HDOD) protein